jgi:hypothetical protein
LKFNIANDHDEPTILMFETLFCMWECFSMGTELPTKVMLGQTLVLMQMTFLNDVREVGRLVLSRTSYLYLVVHGTEFHELLSYILGPVFVILVVLAPYRPTWPVFLLNVVQIESHLRHVIFGTWNC